MNFKNSIQILLRVTWTTDKVNSCCCCCGRWRCCNKLQEMNTHTHTRTRHTPPNWWNAHCAILQFSLEQWHFKVLEPPSLALLLYIFLKHCIIFEGHICCVVISWWRFRTPRAVFDKRKENNAQIMIHSGNHWSARPTNLQKTEKKSFEKQKDRLNRWLNITFQTQ